MYQCIENADDQNRRQERDALSAKLERAIRDVLVSDDYVNSLPAQPEVLAFPAQEPKDGAGRFRRREEALGVTEGYPGRPAEEVKLADGPTVWLRVMPLDDPGRKWAVSELKATATVGALLMPLYNGAGSYGYVRAHDGYGTYWADGSLGSTHDVAFLFNTGEVWVANSYYLQVTTDNGIVFIEDKMGSALERYAKVLENLGIRPPYRWIAGMEGIKGRGLWVPVQSGYVRMRPGPIGKCLLDSVEEKGFHTPGESPIRSLKPFFTKLFESCGLDRPEWLDSDERS
jgi:hypothetical protein